MHMSSESLLVILFVGLVAGWLAGQIVQGTGFGLIGDLIVGILGAFFGSWLLPQLGIHLGTGLISAIVNATIGAVLLLLIVRLVRGGGGVAKELVASIDTYAARAGRGFVSATKCQSMSDGISAHGSRLISGLSYKTAFSNELLTSIFPL
jgi:uncharacterized membrane protein YeaQ/YmgE (transglycosylase-associated protein family)